MRVAVIAGGCGGIGASIACHFAQKGISVAVSSRSSKKAQDFAKFLPSGIQPTQSSNIQTSTDNLQHHKGIEFNITDYSSVETAIERVERELGPVNIFVNSVGINFDNLLLRTSETHIQDTINTNVLGTINANKVVAKSMIRNNKGGCIINISSVVGIHGNVGQSIYSASKAAIIGFSKSLSKEVGSRGIRVNVIAPGFISDTPMTTGYSEEYKNKIKSQIPLNRFGTPEEVAMAALFLTDCTYITGQVIQVDGGIKF